MNIALITNDFLPIKGGITNVMLNVSKNLTELGDKVYVFNKTCNNEEKLYFRILSNDNSLKGFVSHNIKFISFLFELVFRFFFSFKGINFKDKLKLAFIYCFYLKFIVRRVISIKNLVEYFKKFKIDIILSGTSSIPLLYSYILSIWFKIPIISIAHGDDFLVRYPFKIKEYIFEHIQKIIVTNKFMKRLFLKIYDSIPSEKIKIINLGVDIQNCEVKETLIDLRNKFGFDKKDFIILTVSRLYPRKGFETILKALRLIMDEHPNLSIKYLIIGAGEEQKTIEKQVSSLKLENMVNLLGEIDELKKNQYYKLSNLFIMVPEIKKNSIEGFGIVYIEANYFHLPVIGTRTGGVKLAIEDGRTGFLIEPKDEISLKHKIMLLYYDKPLRIKLGDYGHNRVIEHFNWQKLGLKYRSTLLNVLKEYHKKDFQ